VVVDAVVWVFGVTAAVATVILIWPRRAAEPAGTSRHAAKYGAAVKA
jgi:hypothetical protein